MTNLLPSENLGSTVMWHPFFGVEDSYSRIDYLVLSPGMAKEWVTNETYIPTISNWASVQTTAPCSFELDNK